MIKNTYLSHDFTFLVCESKPKLSIKCTLYDFICLFLFQIFLTDNVKV